MRVHLKKTLKNKKISANNNKPGHIDPSPEIITYIRCCVDGKHAKSFMRWHFAVKTTPLSTTPGAVFRASFTRIKHDFRPVRVAEANNNSTTNANGPKC